MGSPKNKARKGGHELDCDAAGPRTADNGPRAWSEIKHFKPRDFTCKCDGFCDHADLISLDLVAKLDKIHDLIGVPFTVISGTRCPRYNRKINGAPDSPHLARDGESHAVHVRCPNASFRFTFLAAALPMFKRIALGKDFIHIDDDPALPTNVIWLS